MDERTQKEINFLLKKLSIVGYSKSFIRQTLVKLYPACVDYINSITTEDAQEGRHQTITELVKQYVKDTTGAFSISMCFEWISAITQCDKNTIRAILHRFHKNNEIAKYGDKDGWYITVAKDLQKINWTDVDITPSSIALPFNLTEYVSIYPKNIITVAGEPNSGKTAFCLNIAKMNIGNGMPIRYFSSEMGAVELKIRLSKFNDISQYEWQEVEFYERCSNFAPVINPNGINIIDYMELSDAFYKIAEYTREIYEALDKGICIIAIQKDKKSDVGRGGVFGLEKPRLYLNMGRTKDGDSYIKIVKAKAWANPEVNPNGLVLFYKLFNGCNYYVTENWRHYK